MSESKPAPEQPVNCVRDHAHRNPNDPCLAHECECGAEARYYIATERKWCCSWCISHR